MDKLPLWMVGLFVIVFIVGGAWVLTPAKVTVTGTGIVSVPANIGSFTITLASTGDDPASTLVAARQKIESVRKVLTDINIRSEDVSASEVALTPAGAAVAGAKGYQALSTMTVKTSNVPLVGEMVVKMYEAGASVVSQPVISFENQTELAQEALDKAMDSAREQLSATVGFAPIKKVVSIEQASTGSTGGTSKAAEGQGGSFEIAKVVSVTYRVW